MIPDLDTCITTLSEKQSGKVSKWGKVRHGCDRNKIGGKEAREI